MLMEGNRRAEEMKTDCWIIISPITNEIMIVDMSCSNAIERFLDIKINNKTLPWNHYQKIGFKCEQARICCDEKLKQE